ncbi:cysteine/glutathione ABC transporter ATP-binding protein/permease CydC [Shewanella sp. 10N.286.52.C2]|uniref:heme ABC transporter ATP-binding protein/permease CydC n=1 Tax=unclassified Shewanella TaxID=196818 RepID=UPI000C8549AE|nr:MULTISPECIES: cysteine/glutathione ABC transporter ATP-binding protein/permease CydC [unclassified Shewanella]MDO6777288.1 cysteine/glutathione ABC transporter ATP-binding protein/permease CydC [Shewanella sp. 3_MG-2023]PMG28108.1 cysteine/glutathione ABC transporter ATP-binding protein/permease CydC [Shewanella sp. 10N.286.52.C2]PMH97806.1 cysteine/glutathione ABC transporter ATP-binding protein/permease CydC [Shewanella sp. 10N.286.48.A6]
MQVLYPFLKLFKRQWLMMAIGLFLTCTTILAGIGLLSLSGWFLSATAIAGLTAATALAFNFFTPAGGVRFFSIARTASRYGERLATHEATFKLLTDLRVWSWKKLFPLSASNLQGLRQGDMLNRLVADIDTLDHLYLRLLVPMTASLLTIIALYAFLSWFDLTLALSLCGLLLSVWIVLPLIFYRLGRKPGEAVVDAKRHFRVLILDVIQGQAELSIFAANDRYRQKLRDAETALFNSQTAMANITGFSQGLLIAVNGFAVVMMLYLAGQGVGAQVPPGPLMATMVFATMASIEMMMPISGAFQHLSSCVLSAKRITEITDQQGDIQYGERQFQGGELAATELELNDIHFGYQAERSILTGVNLHITQGQKVALLGPTGCGKSSLLALITREWMPQQGQIRLSGHDIADYDEVSLRNAMTVVSQRVHLFAGTVRDNLTIALPYVEGQKKKANDQRLIAVLKQVGLGTLLESVTATDRGEEIGLDSWIGDGGRQLSGGEQRRIGVARALLRDAPILLLDEPTEGLDKRTEREILRLLFTFAEGKTLLMISHRLTAMAEMDQIHMLDNGLIAASGTHEDLMQDCAEYQGLYKHLAKEA